MTIYRDNIFETSTTQGTGTLTLAGNATGARTYRTAFGDGPVTVAYVIRPAVEDGSFETGIGTFEYTGGNATLARDTVLESSNSDAAVNWGPGTRNVWCAPAGKVIGGLLTTNKGTARPGWLQGGGWWVDEVASDDWRLYFYDGSDDIQVGTFDPTADAWTPSGVVLTAADTANAIAGALAFTPSELTIASGAVTPTRSRHTVDTEADAASDDLATINTGSVDDNTLLILSAANAARTVVLKHGTGNIYLASDADFSLDDDEKSIMLERRGSDWHEVARVGANASAVQYDNSSSGLTAEDVQAAIDEIAGGGVFTDSFESAEQSISSNSVVSAAHGLGAQPKLFQVVLRCKTAELGYSVGDEVETAVHGNDTGFQAHADSTNVGVTCGSSLFIARKSSSIGGTSGLTASNWRIVLRAWA